MRTARVEARSKEARGDEPPRWTRRADEMLRWAERGVRLIGCATPRDLDRVTATLVSALDRGDRPPRLDYPPPPADDPRPVLDEALPWLEPRGALGRLYAERARELHLEATMSRAVGTPSLAELAARRYGPRDDHHADAERLCARWLDEDVQPEAVATIDSDAERPDSLSSRIRAEVGAHRLPFRVIVSSRIAALAATGPGAIYVAPAKRMTQPAIERTVLHEIRGHALPRARARRLLGIFSIGTAHGSDDQEGRALALERRHGWLDAPRRRELARRHLACSTVRRGADLVETARRVIREGRASTREAARIALRAHRGGGLARESVYLPALLRVEGALDRDAGIDQVLGSGQISVPSVDILRPHAHAG